MIPNNLMTYQNINRGTSSVDAGILKRAVDLVPVARDLFMAAELATSFLTEIRC